MSTPPGAATAGKRENIFTHKIGPLPMWAWLGISAAILLGWAYLANKKKPKQGPTNTANASQVPQFVNQTYTTLTPPVGPPMPPKDIDKDKDKGGKKDNDDEQDEDERKHKKKPRDRRHPTHHGDDGEDTMTAHATTGIAPGSQFTPPYIRPRI